MPVVEHALERPPSAGCSWIQGPALYGDRVALKLHKLPRADLAALAQFHVAVDPHPARCDGGHRLASAAARADELEEVFELHVVVVVEMKFHAGCVCHSSSMFRSRHAR